MGKGKPTNITNNSLKYKAAQQLGLLDKVKSKGWANLTAQETGRIGGVVTKLKKQKKAANK
ncbi:MAG: small, acid-soluble spore protein, alpha/beta type [Clostridia bacterium]|nr:small, acid-soluble spore protein, alpha/beta type [Clostridia bacterium]